MIIGPYINALAIISGAVIGAALFGRTTTWKRVK